MAGPLYAKQTETDRTPITPTWKPTRPKQSIPHATDSSRLPLYTQAWGNLPPPSLRLPATLQQTPIGQLVQRQEKEHIQGQHLHKENTTGLPDTLKVGVEALSGLPMDDVQVHYHSSQPAQVQALAYTQGTQIHVGPGQEKHLAHEVWHVVQQKQGRVQPTFLTKGVAINDDDNLEREADTMGVKAASSPCLSGQQKVHSLEATPVIRQGKRGTVIQRNAVLKHEYRILENPAYTVAKHLSWLTGVPIPTVLANLNAFNGVLPPQTQLARPDRVIAYINYRTGSGPRPAIITQIGHLGNFEDSLRNRTPQAYNGGHLLALELYRTWPLINDPSNVAPQRSTDNLAPGAWRRAEIALNAAAGRGVLYEASVSYPDRTYTVTAGGMGRAVAPGSATGLAIANLGLLARWTPWTIHTWSPSQYALSVTPITLMSQPTARQTIVGYEPTNWIPILHRLVSPIKGTLFRLVPLFQVIEHHQGFRGVLGGVDVRTLQHHPIGHALNEFKQLAWDIAKLTAIIEYALPLFGFNASSITGLVSMIPGNSILNALIPGFVTGAPLAALLIYAVTHQFNLTRLIPEWPGLDWLRYLLGLLGL